MAQPKKRSPTHTQVHNALKKWHGDSTTDSSLAHLYLYRMALREQVASNPRQATNQLIFQAMEEMRKVSEQDAQLLQLRFFDLRPVHYLSNYFSVAESTFYSMQRKAIDRLADTIRTMEQTARHGQRERLLRRLEPPTYVELIGVESTLDHLMETLTEADSTWLVSVEGLGGIGKTSLADCVVRQMIEENGFDEVGWISARQERFGLDGSILSRAQPALTGDALIEGLARQLIPELVSTDRYSSEDLLAKVRTRLKEAPHLIVIDNLETVLDTESLLPVLQDLVNPSKFLLTTRQSLYSVPNIYHVSVPELSSDDSVALLRQEARLRNLPILADSDDGVLHSIYEVVGGNPLALRLVVGQTHIHALEPILEDLREARGEPVENLYRFIYQRAWNGLDQMSRDVLLVMPLVNPQGDRLEIIAEIGDLSVGNVRRVLNQLVTFNLVDARGGLHERRYSIHGLTRTFLHKQVLKWE